MSEPHTIPLSAGFSAIVDLEDFIVIPELQSLTWHASISPTNVYAKAHSLVGHIFMHRIILKCLDAEKIDHKNGNGLDNRKSNLRIATSFENNANKRKQSTKTTSKFKGVSWFSKDKKWVARIQVRYQKIYLGSFDSEIEAALAYDKGAKEAFGAFARTNF